MKKPPDSKGSYAGMEREAQSSTIDMMRSSNEATNVIACVFETALPNKQQTS